MGDIINTVGGYFQCIGGYSVSGEGYHQYCRGIPPLLWIIFSTAEDVQNYKKYHQCCGGIPSVHWRVFSTVGDIFGTVVGEYHLYI